MCSGRLLCCPLHDSPPPVLLRLPLSSNCPCNSKWLFVTLLSSLSESPVLQKFPNNEHNGPKNIVCAATGCITSTPRPCSTSCGCPSAPLLTRSSSAHVTNDLLWDAEHSKSSGCLVAPAFFSAYVGGVEFPSLCAQRVLRVLVDLPTNAGFAEENRRKKEAVKVAWPRSSFSFSIPHICPIYPCALLILHCHFTHGDHLP